jgi:hypothetical protein
VIFDEMQFPARDRPAPSARATASPTGVAISIPQGIFSSFPSYFISPDCDSALQPPSIQLAPANSPDLSPSLDPMPLTTKNSDSTAENYAAVNSATKNSAEENSPAQRLLAVSDNNFAPSSAIFVPALVPTSPPASPPPSPMPANLVSPASGQPPPRMITRSQTNSLHPKLFPGYKLYSTKYPFLALTSITLPAEPRTYHQAAKNPCWLAAMQAEFHALMSNHTWTLCPRPTNKKVVRNKWVFKLKQKDDGSIDRYKARLVSKGFDQEEGVDFHETFSSVIKPATIPLVLALAVHFHWVIRQLDIFNAFLHGYLEEKVLMEQPKGFEDPNFPDHVCLLHKSIYGLKQAPQAWFMRLSQALLDLGFSSSVVDTSHFMFHHQSIHIFVLIYVDDILVSSNSPSAVSGLIAHLQRDFAVKDLRPLSYFLGIQATRLPHALFLTRSKYVIDLLCRTYMDGAKPASTPCFVGGKLSWFDGDPLGDPTEYRHIVGALQYCTFTRPDIAYSVNQLC